MRIAIYTAIFGKYDVLKDQPRFPETDYICFTDSPAGASRTWNIALVQPPPGEHSRVTAKRFKTTPHKFLPADYDFTIWIDGSIVIVNVTFLEQCISSVKKWGIGCMNHPVGKCIFQEATGCAHMVKYQTQPVIEQAEHYRSLGYPENNGLAACGIIVRDMKNQKLHRIGEDWMAENKSWTYQDQISFPYVLWKNEHWFDPLSFCYTDRSMFVLYDHAHEG